MDTFDKFLEIYQADSRPAIAERMQGFVWYHCRATGEKSTDIATIQEYFRKAVFALPTSQEITEVASSPQTKLGLVYDGERLRVDDSCRRWLERLCFEPVFNAGLLVFKVTGDMAQSRHVCTESKSRVNVASRKGMEGLDLFICHSSADADIAKAIIDLFEKGLKLSAKAILCTSVDGYRLSAGVVTNQALQSEVRDARIFLAILTSRSLASQYVLFELGARWGTGMHLFPLMARGTSAEQLEAPLSGLNALSASERPQVLQLIEDSARILVRQLEPLSSFSAAVDSVVTASNQAETVDDACLGP